MPPTSCEENAVRKNTTNTDTEINLAKVYYEYNPSTQKYQIVETPNVADINLYYERKDPIQIFYDYLYF